MGSCKSYNRRYYYSREPVRQEPKPGEPILRTFECALCGSTVQVVDKKDRRRRFCCRAHEREYWRHEYKRQNASKHGRESQGMSGGMSLESLIRRERRDLD